MTKIIIYASGIILLNLFLYPAFADNAINSETSMGTDTFIQTLEYDGAAASVDDTDIGLLWNIGSTYSRTSTTSNGIKATDNTTSVDGGLGWQHKQLEFGAGLTYANTPAEKLHETGPSAYLSYTFNFGNAQTDSSATDSNKTEANADTDTDSDADSFTPSLTLKGDYGHLNYTALANHNRTEVQLNQTSMGVTATLSPLAWLSVEGAYTHYTYDRNVDLFLNRLNSRRFVAGGLGNFASTVSGLPAHSTEGVITLTPVEKWTIELDDTRTISQSDSSITNATEFIVSHEIGDWEIGVGAEHDHSNSTTAPFTENLGLLNVSYNF